MQTDPVAALAGESRRPPPPRSVPELARADAASDGRAAHDLRRAPETLHPALWLGHQLGRSAAHAVASGFPPLDAELPGGGWPRQAVTELLLPHPGVGEMRLLAPALVATQRAGRLVMLFDPPAALSAAALAALGIAVEDLLVVQTHLPVAAVAHAALAAARGSARLPAAARRADDGGSDSVWALEQALKSGHVGAVVAWLPPRLRAQRLRRLQLAAHHHDGAAFVFREAAAAALPTAAPLRLALQAGGADRLCVRVLKRRGPPLDALLALELPSVLSGAAWRRAAATRDSRRALPTATFVDVAAGL